MRTIRFRCFDKVLKRFLTQEETDRYPVGALNMRGGTVEFTQYTGLEDKNKVKIYEGDIILAYEKTWKVIFDEGCFYAYGPGRYKALRTMESEVIGNVYQKV